MEADMNQWMLHNLFYLTVGSEARKRVVWEWYLSLLLLCWLPIIVFFVVFFCLVISVDCVFIPTSHVRDPQPDLLHIALLISSTWNSHWPFLQPDSLCLSHLLSSLAWSPISSSFRLNYFPPASFTNSLFFTLSQLILLFSLSIIFRHLVRSQLQEWAVEKENKTY